MHTQNEWHRPRPPPATVCTLTIDSSYGQNLANHDTDRQSVRTQWEAEPPTADYDVLGTPDACLYDTLFPLRKHAKGANIGQGGGAEYDHQGNGPNVAHDAHTGELNCATPP